MLFGKGKLMKNGAEVSGRVIESGAAMAFGSGDAGGYHIKARLEFADGTTSEISCHVPHGIGVYDVGEVLPFRYDVDDRSKVVLDEPALKAIADKTRAQVKQIEQEDAAKPIAPGTEPGINSATATAIALEQMSQLEGKHNRGEITDADYETERETIRAEARKYL